MKAKFKKTALVLALVVTSLVATTSMAALSDWRRNPITGEWIYVNPDTGAKLICDSGVTTCRIIQA